MTKVQVYWRVALVVYCPRAKVNWKLGEQHFWFFSVQTQTEATRIRHPRLTPVWPNAFCSPNATFWAGPAVVTATRTGRELAWLCSAAQPHYTATGFDVVCEALPALLQPVALPPGHSSSCQQVSVLPLILPQMCRDTHTRRTLYRVAHGQSPDANMHACMHKHEVEMAWKLARQHSQRIRHVPKCSQTHHWYAHIVCFGIPH